MTRTTTILGLTLSVAIWGCGTPAKAPRHAMSEAAMFLEIAVQPDREVAPCIVAPIVHLDGNRRTVDCQVREQLPPGATCDASLGRTVVRDLQGNPATVIDADGQSHAVCAVTQLPTVDGSPEVGPGWYLSNETSFPDTCPRTLRYTASAAPAEGASVEIECLRDTSGWTGSAPATSPQQPVGGACTLRRQWATASDGTPRPVVSVGPLVFADEEAPECGDGVCLDWHWDEIGDGPSRDQHVYCSCRCDLPTDQGGCACQSGFTCTSAFPDAAYCVRNATGS